MPQVRSASFRRSLLAMPPTRIANIGDCSTKSGSRARRMPAWMAPPKLTGEAPCWPCGNAHSAYRAKIASFVRRRGRHVDGRPRRVDLVRRQDGAVARRDDACAHAHAALRHGRLRRRTLLQDRRRPSDLPVTRPHRPAVPFRADLRDEDSLPQGRAQRGAKGLRAEEQARFLLFAPAGVLWIALVFFFKAHDPRTHLHLSPPRGPPD